MKYLVYSILLVLTIGLQSYAQKPFNQDSNNPNLDFALNNFNNWQLSWGNRGTPYTNDRS